MLLEEFEDWQRLLSQLKSQSMTRRGMEAIILSFNGGILKRLIKSQEG